MFHSFDIEVAELFHDANVATIFQNLCHWIAHNKANNINLHEIEIDGKIVKRYFTFNSIQAFKKIFYYWSPKQISTYLKKLQEKKLICKANFNKLGFDRTSWYCLVDEEYWLSKYLLEKKQIKDSLQGESNKSNTSCEKSTNLQNEHTEKTPILPNGKIEYTETENRMPQMVESNLPNEEIDLPLQHDPYLQIDKPIPDINSDIITSDKHNIKNAASAGTLRLHMEQRAKNLKNVLQELTPDFIFDNCFYHEAAEFLYIQNLETDYAQWLYKKITKNKDIRNFRNYFHAVFCKQTFAEMYKSEREETPLPIKYECPACGEIRLLHDHEMLHFKCENCGAPSYSTQEQIEYYKSLNALENDVRQAYFIESLAIMKAGGNIKEKVKLLKEKYGIATYEA